VENVSKTGKMWRKSRIWGEIRGFLGRKLEKKKKDAKNLRLFGEFWTS